MDAETISGRGRFWLADEGDSMKSELATHGTLTIDGQGTITLHPDLVDWKWGGATDTINSIVTRRFDIVGHLMDRNQYVRIESAFVRRPQIAHNGWYAEDIGASACLLSDAIVPGPGSQACITNLRIPLGPLLAWLQRDMPKTEKTATCYEVRYPISPRQEFSLKSGQLAIESDISAIHDFGQRALTLAHLGWIEFKPGSHMNIEMARKLHSDVEDLLILLTDQEFSLDWPRIQISHLDTTGTLYYTRRCPPTVSFSAFDCWVLFPQIASNFGTVVENWIEMRAKYGPAFHLYLGTRRGGNLWVEHRFVNLVWGLESLYLQSRSPPPKPDLEAKIKRVLGSIGPELKSADLRWLKGLLKSSLKPTLAERICEIFARLPTEISVESLQKFAKTCAQRRNDISHLGGPRGGKGYDEFVLELYRLSGALDPLYHAAILQQIGIPDAVIQHVFFEGIKSAQIRGRFQHAGLCMVKPLSCHAGD